MANSMRWRYGDSNPVVAPTADSDAIEIGDLLYQEAGVAKPVSAQPDAGNELANQVAFHETFLGVAMQASPLGSTAAIRVATTGVFEFDCPATAFELGDLIAAHEDGSGAALANQSVAATADAGMAIARCAKRVDPAGTSVLVEIASAVMRGGPQPTV